MTASKFAESAIPLVADTPAPSLRLAREFARYFACSALALAVDAGLFGLGLRLGLPYPVAAAIGFVAGLAVAYTLSVRVVFRERRLKYARAEFVVFFERLTGSDLLQVDLVPLTEPQRGA